MSSEIKINEPKLLDKDGKLITEDNILPGLLSSPHIRYYVEKYGIINGFIEENLKSAVYQMRLGEDAFRWVDEKELSFRLGPAVDKNKKISDELRLEPNSLTFVTTIEGFNLRKDIIARYNLKSKWTHKGLLLGTGPIVDPEFSSRLCIPVHNFSSKEVVIKYGEVIINVELTKTLNPDDVCDFHSKKENCRKVQTYIPNPNKALTLDDFKKNTLFVESSVYSNFEKAKKEISASKTQRYIISIVGGIAIAALIYAGYQLLQATNAFISEAYKSFYESSQNIKSNIDRNEKLYEQMLHLKRTLESGVTPLEHPPCSNSPQPKGQQNIPRFNSNVTGKPDGSPSGTQQSPPNSP